jgi:hypothetical protein
MNIGQCSVSNGKVVCKARIFLLGGETTELARCHKQAQFRDANKQPDNFDSVQRCIM